MKNQTNAFGQDAKTAKAVRSSLKQAKNQQRIMKAIKNASDESAIRGMPGKTSVARRSTSDGFMPSKGAVKKFSAKDHADLDKSRSSLEKEMKVKQRTAQ